MGKALDELRDADTRYSEWKEPDILLRRAILELAAEIHGNSIMRHWHDANGGVCHPIEDVERPGEASRLGWRPEWALR